MTTTREHWDEVYGRVPVTQVSWFQDEPSTSVALLSATGAGPHEPIVDVGGGASVLADRLLDAGYRDVAVLDVAASALTASRLRLGGRAERVRWIVADLLTWQPTARFRVWHDRAVFHFLTEPDDRDRYRKVLRRAVAPGGHVIVGTFAADGPTHCSGLPVVRYSPEDLAAQFPGFQVVREQRQQHHTPSGGVQPFIWLLLSDREH